MPSTLPSSTNRIKKKGQKKWILYCSCEYKHKLYLYDWVFCRNLYPQSQNWGQNVSEKSNYPKSWPIVHLFSRPSKFLPLNYLLRRRISFIHQRSIRIQQDCEYIFKMFTSVLENIHLKPLEIRLFITTLNEVYPNCFLTFQMLVLPFCSALSAWLFVLCWRYQKQDVICDMRLLYVDMVCGILGLNLSMLDDGRQGEFHWIPLRGEEILILLLFKAAVSWLQWFWNIILLCLRSI